MCGRVVANRGGMSEHGMGVAARLAFRGGALKELLPVPEVLRTQADAYLSALVIFVAPIIAIPEYLGKYRLHGANLFQVSDQSNARGRIEHRMEMRGALLGEIKGWLERHGYNLREADLQTYFKQWTKAQEQDGYAA